MESDADNVHVDYMALFIFQRFWEKGRKVSKRRPLVLEFVRRMINLVLIDTERRTWVTHLQF